MTLTEQHIEILEHLACEIDDRGGIESGDKIEAVNAAIAALKAQATAEPTDAELIAWGHITNEPYHFAENVVYWWDFELDDWAECDADGWESLTLTPAARAILTPPYLAWRKERNNG